MNISLTPELEKYVKKKVKSGLYNSSSEVVREALRLLEENDTLRKARFQELRREIARGIEQADAGKIIRFDVDAINAEGRRRMKQK